MFAAAIMNVPMSYTYSKNRQHESCGLIISLTANLVVLVLHYFLVLSQIKLASGYWLLNAY